MNTHQQLLSNIQQMTKELGSQRDCLRREVQSLTKEIALQKAAIGQVKAERDQIQKDLAIKVAEYEALLRAPAPPRGMVRAVQGISE